jgi:hypothetical protein
MACPVPLDPVLVSLGLDTHPMCEPRAAWGDLPAGWYHPAEAAECGAAGRLYPCTPADADALAGGMRTPGFWTAALDARCQAHAPAVPPSPVFGGQAEPCTTRPVAAGVLLARRGAPPAAARARPPCGGCGHSFHRDQCSRKGPARAWLVLDPATGEVTGRACGARPQCPCPWGACHTCGAPVVGASTLPLYDGSPEIDIDRGSAGDPAGTLAVRELPDGTLAVRRLGPGEGLADGEWRGRQHAHRLTPASNPDQRREAIR